MLRIAGISGGTWVTRYLPKHIDNKSTTHDIFVFDKKEN